MAEIKFVKAPALKEKADVSTIGFGTYFTDYMFRMDYNPEEGWHGASIVPYEDIKVSPANTTLHYGQAIFEGCKAYVTREGKPVVFRGRDHIARLNRSAKILDIPQVPFDEAYNGLIKLLSIEKDWIPKGPGQSLYIRPFIFASDPFLGVSVSQTYVFLIILSPVAAYYAHGFAPVKIMVEDHYSRACQGGLGAAKTPANYAASLHAGLYAHEKGYDQVLWTDAAEHKWIGEVGSMNILFKIDGKIVTPELDGTILDGITRRTVLQIARDWGYPVEERKISVDELVEAYKSGKLEEVFGSGTAAVISPVGELICGTENPVHMVLNEGKIGPFAQKMYDYIDKLHTGETEDKYGFVEPVE